MSCLLIEEKFAVIKMSSFNHNIYASDDCRRPMVHLGVMIEKNLPKPYRYFSETCTLLWFNNIYSSIIKLLHLPILLGVYTLRTNPLPA